MTDRRYKLVSDKYKELFLPTLAMTLSNNMALFVDSVLVSTFLGVERMPAIQLCFPVLAFVNMMYWMLGLGGSLAASNAVADHDRDKANRYFTISIMTVMVFGILVALLGNLLMPQLSILLCRDEQLRPDVIEYGRVMVTGMPLLCFNMSLSYFARADGHPKVGFRMSLISNGVNLCMDIVLMKILGMGLKGGALGTIIGYICGLAFMAQYLFSKKRQMRFVNPFGQGQFFDELKDICGKGLPTASSQIYMMLKAQILNNIIAVFGGAVGLQLYSVYNNSLFLIGIIIIGTGQTLSPIVSVYAHEGDYNRARFVLERSIKIALLGAMGIGLLLLVFPQILMHLYRINDPETVDICRQAIRIFALSYPGNALFFVLTYYFQAIDRKRLSAVLIAVEGLVLPVGFMALFAPLFGLTGIWTALVIDELVAAIIVIVYVRLAKKMDKALADTEYLLPAGSDPDRYEFTIGMNIKEAVRLPVEAADRIKDELAPEVSMKTCLALEEMLTGIVMANGERDDVIDIVLRKEEGDVFISIRDMGKEFNPTIEDKSLDLKFDNVYVLNRIASEIKYDLSIGMNLTLIRIGCEARG